MPSWPEHSPAVLPPPPASLPASCIGAYGRHSGHPTPPSSHIPLSILANGTAGRTGLLTDRTPVIYAHQASSLPSGSSTTLPAGPAPYMISVRGGSQAHPSHSEPSGCREGPPQAGELLLGKVPAPLGLQPGEGGRAWGLRRSQQRKGPRPETPCPAGFCRPDLDSLCPGH